jgi:hypothetical protein
MNRVMPHLDFHAGSDFRLSSEFEFDFEDGRNGGPRPGIDEDRGDVHQAWKTGDLLRQPQSCQSHLSRRTAGCTFEVCWDEE